MFEEFLSPEKVNLTKILLIVLGGKCECPGEGRMEGKTEDQKEGQKDGRKAYVFLPKRNFLLEGRCVKENI